MKKTDTPVKKKKHIHIKAVVLVLVLASVAALLITRGIITIRKIDIVIVNSKQASSAETKITKEQVLSLSGLKVGDKLYKNLRSEISQKIEENPYVKEAKIERNFGGKIKITITQRDPKYLMNYAGEFIYIDREGYVLEVSGENNGNPIIIGFTTDCSSLSVGNTKIRLNKEDLEKLEIVNNIMAALENNEVLSRVYTINVENIDDFVLQLNDDLKSVHIGDGSDLNTRILYMKKILTNEVGHSGTIYVNGDLNESYVYFREQ